MSFNNFKQQQQPNFLAKILGVKPQESKNKKVFQDKKPIETQGFQYIQNSS